MSNNRRLFVVSSEILIAVNFESCSACEFIRRSFVFTFHSQLSMYIAYLMNLHRFHYNWKWWWVGNRRPLLEKTFSDRVTGLRTGAPVLLVSPTEHTAPKRSSINDYVCHYVFPLRKYNNTSSFSWNWIRTALIGHLCVLIHSISSLEFQLRIRLLSFFHSSNVFLTKDYMNIHIK